MAVAVDFSPLSHIGEQLIRRYQYENSQDDRNAIQEVANAPGELSLDNLARAAAPGNIGAAAQIANLAETQRVNRQTDADLRQVMPLLGSVLSGRPAGTATTAAQPSGNQANADSYLPRGLLTNESGGNWTAQNNEVGAGGLRGHFGRLQFGQARLNDAIAAGVLPPNTTPQQFMASPELQRRTEQWHFNDIDNFIRRNGLDQYIGQNVGGVPVTWDGMRNVAHLGGPAGLLRYLQTNGQYNPADANGTRLGNYMQAAAAAGAGNNPVAATLQQAQAGQAQPATAAAAPAQVASAAPAATATDASPAAAAPTGAVPLPPPDPRNSPAATPAPATAQAAPAAAPAAPAAPAVPGNPADVSNVQSRLLENLPVIARVLANRNLPAPVATMLNNMMQQAMQESRGTPEYQQWREYRQQGGQSTFPQFLEERRPQGAVGTFYDENGNQYQGVVDPRAPNGVRRIGGPVPAARTYREVRLPNGDSLTITTDAQGNDTALLNGQSLSDYMTNGANGGRSQATNQALQQADVTRASERMNTIQQQSISAQRLLPTLDRMEAIVNNNRLWQGTGAERNEAVRSWLVSTGWAPESQVRAAADADQLAALAHRGVMEALGGSLGPGVSNSDVNYMNTAFPGLMLTQQGNREVINFMRGVQERAVLQARFARAYQDERVNGQRRGMLDNGFENAWEDFQQRNPINEVQRRPDRYIVVTNQQEFNALRPGQVAVFRQQGQPDEWLRRN